MEVVGVASPPANHRRWDLAAVARLDLVRTLRDLGLDLPTIKGVLAEDLTVADHRGARPGHRGDRRRHRPGDAGGGRSAGRRGHPLAETFETADSVDYRGTLLERLRTANDPRVERYVRLIGIINDWPATPPPAPVG
ncbi:hypothetical protein O7635_04435 [Asanoa sp. WMMD1127]|uniref:hypothetical protein n=1 Tax=Asanoa sp. WMMD1127 TaxID=3016107 RepID=UPI0024167967|nr:hypothetical protein [Asanoa sp. WMMD1127]MDG4821101.1 hypothetical protein [Asanoa sp. WMMD1127]